MPRPDHRLRGLSVELLESRTLLAVTPSGSDLSVTSISATGTGGNAPFTLTPTAEAFAPDAPWNAYAQQSRSGTVVTRVLFTPAADGTSDPTTQIDLLQARFNPPTQSTASSPTTSAGGPSDQSAAPTLTGEVFPGRGVPVLPTDTWPRALDSFDSTKLPANAPPQEYFVVFESDSNLMLGTVCFVMSAASDPSLQQTNANAGGNAGVTGDPTSGDVNGTPNSGDQTNLNTLDANGLAGLAGLMAFAMLAGAGSQQGLTVSLKNDTGTSANDGITSDGRLQVDTSPHAKVEYSTDGGRTWRGSFHAREGRNDVQVRATDATDGQFQVSQVGFSFTLDTRPPAVPQVSLQTDTGRSATDRITSVGDLAIRRQGSGCTLEYSMNGGAWTSSYTPVEGRNRVLVRQIDAAGNASRPSSPLIFRLDTQVAAVAFATMAQVTSMNAAGTSRRARIIGLEQGALVQYSTDNAATWNRRAPSASFHGQVAVRQIDLAGNISSPAFFAG